MTFEQRYDALAAVPELSAIPAQARATLAASMRQERFAAGETVIAIGDRADRVFVLCEGMLDRHPGRPGRSRCASCSPVRCWASLPSSQTVSEPRPCAPSSPA